MPKLHKKTKNSLKASIAAFIVIAVLGLITEYTHFNMIIAPLGSTCAIVFGMPNSPAARARNILFTYIMASVTAYLLYYFFGYHVIVMAAGVAIAVYLMIYENLIHPPAAGIPIFFYYIKPQPEFLLFPILSGCVVILIARKIYRKLWMTR